MQIRVVAVGKLREKYLRDGINEYLKRLQSYCRLEIVEVKDESFRESELASGREAILEREAESVLREIPSHTHMVLLDVSGDMVSSESLAARIEGLGISGQSHITFVIGGTLGVAEPLRRRADWRWSFSPLTFPHQLIRLMLMEQLYRAFTIIRGEPYHR